METWLGLARGPFFWGALSFMILGLGRHVAIGIIEASRAVRHAGDRRMPYRRIAKVTLSWLFPITRFGQRTVIGAVSFAFHVAVILVPIFLAEHIALWRQSLGLSWPAIPNGLADVLTIVAVSAAVILVVERAIAKEKRYMSRFQDYALPIVIAVPFATGLLVAHPAWNPLPYEVALLIHLLSADLLLVLMPITKLNHAALMPEAHLITEAAWHWPAGAGREVGIALGKEGEPV
jgi:nitrate reductase gamma subunit